MNKILVRATAWRNVIASTMAMVVNPMFDL
jgi:hypothetical protein